MKILKNLKNIIFNIIKFIFKEIFSFFIKFTLIIILLGVFLGMILKYSIEEKVVIEPESYIVIDFKNQYKEKSENLPSFIFGEETNFYTLIKKVEQIGNDDNVKGIFLKLDGLSLDRAQVEELDKSLKKIKQKGKEIISYATTFDNKNYTVALSSDLIIMPPTTTTNVNLIGYYTELPYYKNLANRFGVGFNVIHVGDYKAYGENYIRETMSNEYRENIVRLHEKIYSNFVDKVSENRNIIKENINRDILSGYFVSIDSYHLKQYNLVDELLYENQIESIFKDKLLPIEKYNLKIDNTSKNKIALIHTEGNILMDGDRTSINSVITPEEVYSELDEVLKNDSIKGVVIRINSPGGSALASNLINNKINEIKEKKPVYISIGGIAASGGYYIAAAGNKIFADKESITGSIGVVSLIPNFNKLLDKIGVNIESVKKGEYSDLYSLTKEFTTKDEEKIYSSSLKVYSEFLDKVAQGRNLDRNYVHSIAQGKVWLGEEAKELGLIDEIGGLDDSISRLASDIGLKNYDVVEIVKNQNINSLIKRYNPSIEVVNKMIEFQHMKELYFKPIYYFPYNI